MSHLRGNVDDGAWYLGGEHLVRYGLRHEVRRPKVQIEDSVEIVFRRFQHRLRTVRPCIVDENIKGVSGLDNAPHGRRIQHIQHNCIGASAIAANAFRRILDFTRGSGGQRDMCARFRQCGRGGKADTAPATGDKGASSVQAEGRGSWQFDRHEVRSPRIVMRCMTRR